MNETSKDLLQRYRAQLGTEFGTAFHGLFNDWSLGLMRLKEFRELFGCKGDVALLNALTGDSFTWDIQHIFWDDLLLRVCRLTDPPRSGRKLNLSITRLPSFVKKKEPKLCQEVQSCIDTAVKEAEFARDSRNRRISHSDWDRAMQRGDPLAQATLQQVGSALDAVHAVLNTISARLLNVEIANAVVVPARAREFLHSARQLVDSVKFIDGLIDREGETRFTDVNAARTFLRKLGRKPNEEEEQVLRVIELRETSRRYP